jgi:hypothetical protein
MPSNQTPNYALSQWERDDRVLMDDFNADNAKIDAALKAEADARAALAAKTGNCSIGMFTYQGTGEFTAPTRISFPRMPDLFLILGSALLIGRGGENVATMSYNVGGYGHTGLMDLSWSGNSFSFLYAGDIHRQMNEKRTYTVIAFYAED